MYIIHADVYEVVMR